jgi:uncharacterized YokU family protein
MKMDCLWCNTPNVEESENKDCYWIMPDGKRSIKVLQVPAVNCPECGIYVSDSMNQKVDEALSIYDVSEYPDEFTYDQLLQAPIKKLFNWK